MFIRDRSLNAYINLTPQPSQPSNRHYCIQILNCRVKEEVKTCICTCLYEYVTYSQSSKVLSDHQVNEAETSYLNSSIMPRALVELINVEIYSSTFRLIDLVILVSYLATSYPCQ